MNLEKKLGKRSKMWLAKKMGISIRALHYKIKNDGFSVSEKYFIENLLKEEK